MPIVVSRKTGKIISAPEITQEQKDAVWAIIVKLYAQKHPEIFNTDKEGDTYGN
ncbi:MAG: hypothetical protein J6K03_01385 [Oscillospiraceae bacterium]|nr:hypothetical protein [Oscillospiraceae bacterium]